MALTEEERRQRHAAQQREWRRKNPEKVRDIQTKYRAKCGRYASPEARERDLQRMREWKANNPERQREHKRKYDQSPRGREARREYQRRKIMRQLTALDRKLLADPLYSAANKAVPEYLPQFMRDDMIADICVAVLSGDFTVADIPKRAKEIITANHRMFSKFGPVSLDAPMFDDGKRTLHDTVSSSLWDN